MVLLRPDLSVGGECDGVAAEVVGDEEGIKLDDWAGGEDFEGARERRGEFALECLVGVFGFVDGVVFPAGFQLEFAGFSRK